MKQGVPSYQDVILWVVFVFGTETEYSGILCKVDGLEELGTARDGPTGSGKDCECSIPSGVSMISSLSFDISSAKLSLNDLSSYFVAYVFSTRLFSSHVYSLSMSV